jgi:hypothetical protein
MVGGLNAPTSVATTPIQVTISITVISFSSGWRVPEMKVGKLCCHTSIL